jgi:hypothetical protein
MSERTHDKPFGQMHSVRNKEGQTGWGASRTKAEKALDKAEEMDVEYYQDNDNPGGFINANIIGPSRKE